jgi:hypothetical protein
MSPIKNLTDRGGERTVGRFERIGKLRKGGPMRPHPSKPGKFIMGVELEYFRFTSDQPEVLAAFREAYGEQPALIRVILPFATAEENFSTWREEWVAGGLMHRCDGETQYLWRDEGGLMRHTPRECDGLRCQPVGRLLVVIPELLERGFVGYVTMETHSLNDLANIAAGLHAAEDMARTRTLGLRGVYCVLRRVQAKISTPSGTDGKRASRAKWLVSLQLDSEWVRAQFKRALDEQLRPAALLTAGDGDMVDIETGEITSADVDAAHLNDPFSRDDVEADEDDVVDGDVHEAPDHEDEPMAAPLTDRPWSRERVMALLRDYVEQAGVAGDAPPRDYDAELARKLVQTLLGVRGAKAFLKIVFRNNDWGGISQAKADALTKIWCQIDRQGNISVPDKVLYEEALAVVGGEAALKDEIKSGGNPTDDIADLYPAKKKAP